MRTIYIVLLILMVLVTVTAPIYGSDNINNPKKKSKKMQNCNKIGVQKVKVYKLHSDYRMKLYNNSDKKDKYLKLQAERFKTNIAQAKPYHYNPNKVVYHELQPKF